MSLETGVFGWLHRLSCFGHHNTASCRSGAILTPDQDPELRIDVSSCWIVFTCTISLLVIADRNLHPPLVGGREPTPLSKWPIWWCVLSSMKQIQQIHSCVAWLVEFVWASVWIAGINAYKRQRVYMHISLSLVSLGRTWGRLSALIWFAPPVLRHW